MNVLSSIQVAWRRRPVGRRFQDGAGRLFTVMTRAAGMLSPLLLGLLLLGSQILVLPILSPSLQADSPVGRRTDHRYLDLHAALIQQRRFDDAFKLCQSLLKNQPPDQDVAARWTTELVATQTARQMQQSRFEETDIERIQEPIVELLRRYPDHPRRLFLQAGLAKVVRQAAVHRVLRAAVNPSDESLQDAAARQLTRATSELADVIESVAEASSVSISDRTIQQEAQQQDMQRLQQELQVALASTALLQTDLFAPGSDDRIATASEAERIIDETIVTLPATSPARAEMMRLRIEAILRSGQIQRAQKEFQDWFGKIDASASPVLRALATQIDLADGNLDAAAQRIDSFYQGTPSTAPRSIEMDLARLALLLDQQQSDAISRWLDQMQQRGGDYARRRGEALAVSRLARRGDTNDPSELDPAIIAAQGQAWLRRGDKARAARLLAAAAAAQRDPDRSIKRAAEAAAAFIAAGQAGEASRVLQTVALARPTAQQAAATHLQAAVLISRMEPVNADELESVLRTNLRKWPKGKTAGVVRGWLIKLLRSQRRFTDAAIIATTIVPQEIDAGRMQTAIELWNRAFEAASTSRDEEIRRQMTAAFEPITESPFAVAAFRLLAGIQLPTSQLADLPARAADRSAAERQRFHADFVDALIQFRRRRVAAAILRSPPLELRSAAETRLMQDGRSQRQRRQAIAQLVQQWPTSDQSNLKESIAALNKIERLVWLGQTAAALQLLDTLLEVYSQDVELIGEAASRLAAAGTPETQQRAVELWDQLAAGTSTGSQRWHEARLSAIELLLVGGESEEASKRARYILLTTKSIPVEFRERYEAAAKKFSSSSSESGTSEP